MKSVRWAGRGVAWRWGSVFTGNLPKLGAASCSLWVTMLCLFRVLERLRACGEVSARNRHWTKISELSVRFSSTKAAPRFRRMDYQVTHTASTCYVYCMEIIGNNCWVCGLLFGLLVGSFILWARSVNNAVNPAHAADSQVTVVTSPVRVWNQRAAIFFRVMSAWLHYIPLRSIHILMASRIPFIYN